MLPLILLCLPLPLLDLRFRIFGLCFIGLRFRIIGLRFRIIDLCFIGLRFRIIDLCFIDSQGGGLLNPLGIAKDDLDIRVFQGGPEERFGIVKVLLSQHVSAL